MAVAIKVDGADEIRKKLSKLLPKEANAVARRTMVKFARTLRDEMREQVPVDEGTLQKAIVAKRKRGRRGETEAAVEITKDGYYWHFIEFGTRTRPPRPFIRPAVEALRKTFPRELGREFMKQISSQFAKRTA